MKIEWSWAGQEPTAIPAGHLSHTEEQREAVADSSAVIHEEGGITIRTIEEPEKTPNEELYSENDGRDPEADLDALPEVPPGFTVQLFAKEPMVRNPGALAFDAQGRLFVGQGPQYRNPEPDTPKDSVLILEDLDGDGMADQSKTFAAGFNCIQGLAWYGGDLYVANSPDLTVVRDLDGDDEADEYVKLYTDLGNLEHGLNGLNFAPDGRLYISKGNSKGLGRPGRVAPKPFRELWSIGAPPGSPRECRGLSSRSRSTRCCCSSVPR
jgi:glucose/arabinose dehydrogenase